MRSPGAVRWQRFGKDRLYVNGPDGAPVGWRDLVSGEDHIDATEATEMYRTTVAAWLTAQRPNTETTTARDTATPSTEPLEQLEGDATPAAGGDARPDAAHGGESSHPDLDDLAASALAPEAIEPVWEDLAGRGAGTAARKQALQLRRERPLYTLATRAMKIHTDERAWRIGADGEEKVGTRLAKLAKRDRRWRILHAIPVGENGSDIDHLVIGPAGIFSLNSKHHPKAKLWVAGNTFLVNGQYQPYIRNSRFEAKRVAKLLQAAAGRTLPVTGIVVPVGAASLEVKEPPAGVHVVSRMRLVGWLTSLPQTLAPEVAEEVFEVARRSTTWSGGTGSSSGVPPSDHMARGPR